MNLISEKYMQKIRFLLPFDVLVEWFLLFISSSLVYLLFIPKFGYFNDDWYLMYAAGAGGPSVFWGIFAVDRPLRALVMIPAYSLFGNNPLYYNLATFLFRLIGSFCFLWVLRMLWPQNRRMTFWMALLFVLYPGFLSQPNAIDYLCHIVGLAAGMFSIGLTIKSMQAISWQMRLSLYLASLISGWFYLGQIEWYIGLEFLRFAFVFLISFRIPATRWDQFLRFVQASIPAALIPAGFLIWRLFFFTSERGATDVDLQLGAIRAEPFTFVVDLLSILVNDVLDVLVRAWGVPLRRMSYQIDDLQWLPGLGIALLVVLIIWLGTEKFIPETSAAETHPSYWKGEVFWTGLGILVCGLLPVLLVGRTVDFKSFSRYTLIASVGTAMLWPLLISQIPNRTLRHIFFTMLILLASLTHYANGLTHAQETELTRNFWWQVSWRIPQMKVGTTLIAHNAVVAEEDYFTWGPANLIYYPSSNNQRYVQPSVYALLLNADTVEKVLAGEAKEFSNRRSIRTYPNYHNILILTQPTPASCMHMIDLHQVELSSKEDTRVAVIASYSDGDHLLTDEPFHTPPMIPFGTQPAHGWCYFYEKADYARQRGDWAEVAQLGDQALSNGFSAGDAIEWLPFLQAYARQQNISRLDQIAAFVTADPQAAEQACRLLTAMPLDPLPADHVSKLFCLK